MSTLVESKFMRQLGENVEDYIYRVCTSKNEIKWDIIVETLRKNIDRSGDEYTHSLYVHENITNGKKYVGITSQPVRNRWRDGAGYKTQKLFWRGIVKYGWDGFNHIVIFDKLLESEANSLEVKLIELFDTRNNKLGYNCGFGGEFSTLGYHNAEGYSIPVYQYNIPGKFLAEYPSMMEAERVTGINNSAICSCCKGVHAYTKEYRWSYEKVDQLPYFDKIAHRKEYMTKKPVYQYRTDGSFVGIFESLMSASQITGFSFKGISSVCLGDMKQYKGFVWKYEYSESVPPIKSRYERMAETQRNNRMKKLGGVS